MTLKRTLCKTAIMASSAAWCLAAYADSPENPASAGSFTGIASIGVTFGGDTFTEVEFDNGDDEKIKAGELALFSGGLVYEQNDFQLQATLGYYSDRASGDNGDVCFTRIPVEVLGFWKQEKFRLGAGIAHHLNPEFEVDIDGNFSNGTVAFDDATGFVVQADYLFEDGIALGLRFTAIEYEEDSIAEKIDGDSIGIMLSYIF